MKKMIWAVALVVVGAGMAMTTAALAVDFDESNEQSSTLDSTQEALDYQGQGTFHAEANS